MCSEVPFQTCCLRSQTNRQTGESLPRTAAAEGGQQHHGRAAAAAGQVLATRKQHRGSPKGAFFTRSSTTRRNAKMNVGLRDTLGFHDSLSAPRQELTGHRQPEGRPSVQGLSATRLSSTKKKPLTSNKHTDSYGAGMTRETINC